MTTLLYSKIASIEELRFSPLGSKIVNAVKAASTDGTTVVLGADGILYCSGIKDRIAYSFTSRSLDNALSACVKMKLLTAEAVRQHRQAEKERAEKQDRQYLAEAFGKYADKLGIKLTKAQENAIAKARGEAWKK